jgi:arylsulfatase A-like enzyme
VKKQKSLVLVTVDCMRADHAGFMGYRRPTTPYLDRLAAESFVFPMASVAGAPTYYSFPAILASRYPLALGRDVLGIGPGEPTLASALQGSGYATAAFLAGNPYLSERFGYDQGFTVFEDSLRDQLEPTSEVKSPTLPLRFNRTWHQLNRRLDRWAHASRSLGRIYDSLYFQYCQRLAMAPPESMDALRRFPAAEVIVSQALDWVSSVKGSPFFLWLHLMDPHAPYYPKPEALRLMGTGEISAFRARYLNSCWNRSDLSSSGRRRYCEDVVALYDAGIRWVDVQMARLSQRLKETDLWEDCVFALTADHGEEFLDHGGCFHPPSRLTEELIHVPLLLRVPGTPKRELPKSLFSLLHLAPTLMDVLQLEIPSEFRGQSHWKRIVEGTREEDVVAVSESVAECTNPFQRAKRLGSRVLVIRRGQMKLVLHLGTGAEELFDLQADPQENSPLPIDAGRETRRQLLDSARIHIQDSRSKREPEMRLRASLREIRNECLQSDSRAGELG